MAAVPSAANAAIVYSGPLNQGLSSSIPYVFSGLTGNPSILVNKGKAESPSFVTTNGMQLVGTSLALNLPANTEIGVSLSFAATLFTDNGTSPSLGEWDANQTGYVGFRVPNGVDFNYGWIEMTTGNSRVFNATIRGWAYESNLNESIQAGAIPEPATSLLSLGGAMLMFLRRRRVPASEAV